MGDIGQAAALHRRASALAQAAGDRLGTTGSAPGAPQREQHELAERLRAAAASLVPGWLGAPLDAQAADTPLGGLALPEFVRIGTAQPLDDARFPAVVPLLRHGHLTVDADGRDPRVAGLLRCVLLRLIAAAPTGSLLVRTVDTTSTGIFTPFAPLTEAGLMAPVATDHAGLRTILTEAEQRVRPGRSGGARGGQRERTLLVVIAALPELVEGADLARLNALAEHGPDGGLHLLVAGWPPPPLTAETTAPPLVRTTMVAMRNPYALVGDPPGSSFGTPLPHLPSTGLNSPVFLDPDPPGRLIERVCVRLAERAGIGSSHGVADLLPGPLDELWTGDTTDGLTATVGHDGPTPVTLRFNELTPHWLVAGRTGAGKSSFLTNVLYGLCANYHPDQLSVHLLSLAEGETLAALTPVGHDPSWLPQLRLVGLQADREYVLTVLTELAAGLADRPPAESGRAEDSAASGGHRVLCVLDEFQLLLSGDDRIATEAAAVLDSLARGGRTRGVHLLLAGQPLDRPAPAERESLLGQFPVRVALPGGARILEPDNDAAAGLPSGAAVVNTAGGLGGPRGATRGHERMIRFPDPNGDQAVLDALRQRIRAARGVDLPPPAIFAGYAEQYLEDDPTYQALRGTPDGPVADPPAALLGRVVDARLPTATFHLDRSAGRHLAVVGPDPAGAAVLVSAARSLALQHPAGTARFVIAAAGDQEEMAAGLATELAERHLVDRVGLGEMFAVLRERPGYLLVFGIDEAAVQPPATFLRDGPGHGTHLLAWWRQPGRFTALAGDTTMQIAGLLLLGTAGGTVAQLLWPDAAGQPRAGRALLHDRHGGRTDVIIPFSPSGGLR